MSVSASSMSTIITVSTTILFLLRITILLIKGFIRLQSKCVAIEFVSDVICSRSHHCFSILVNTKNATTKQIIRTVQTVRESVLHENTPRVKLQELSLYVVTNLNIN